MRKILIALMLLMSCVAVSPAFADDYNHVTFFNHVSDWSVSFWRAPDARDRVVHDRMQARAQWRQDRDHRFHSDEHGSEHGNDHGHDNDRDHR